jgi:hypothetical protein
LCPLAPGRGQINIIVVIDASWRPTAERTKKSCNGLRRYFLEIKDFGGFELIERVMLLKFCSDD